MDLNGKILEMKISTEIGDGSWPDRDGRELVKSFQEDFFLGKSLNKGLIGRGL